MATSTVELTDHKIASHSDWLQARMELLAKEKEFTRLRDELSRQRRELAWERVEKTYGFNTPQGEQTLAELFGKRSQLLIYHFMLGPGWQEGCKSCSYMADQFDGMAVHLANRDVMLMAVSRAPLEEIERFKNRMGWKFRWVSSFGSDFNRDFHVSFTKEEMARGRVEYNYGLQEFPSEEAPGASVFYKNAAGEVFHTYSCYARGLDILVGAYNFLDLVPKGRDEGTPTMAWVRHHDRYEDQYLAETGCCSHGKS